MGILASAVLNALGARRRHGGGQFKPADFMPFVEREQESAPTLWQRLGAVFSRFRKEG